VLLRNFILLKGGPRRGEEIETEKYCTTHTVQKQEITLHTEESEFANTGILQKLGVLKRVTPKSNKILYLFPSKLGNHPSCQL
jgi:hypothetical protein